MKEPVNHIERPELPWRKPEQTLTECGLVALSYPTVTRDQFRAQYKELGQQRLAMLTCMTCFDRARHYGTWDDDPLDGMERAMRLEPHSSSYWNYEHEFNRSRAPAPNSPLRLELRAMALLVAAHRDEFDALVKGLGEVVDLGRKRIERRQAEKEAKRSKKPWDFH